MLEMLPLASDLVERGEAAAVRQRIAESGKPCVMYEGHPTDPLKGRCTVYELRPTMCRLYGFAARTSTERPGGKQYVPCVRHEELQPEAVAEAQRKLEAEGLDIPMIATEHARVMMVNRNLGRETLPINEALRRALDLVEEVRRDSEMSWAP